MMIGKEAETVWVILGRIGSILSQNWHFQYCFKYDRFWGGAPWGVVPHMFMSILTEKIEL